MKKKNKSLKQWLWLWVPKEIEIKRISPGPCDQLPVVRFSF